MQATSRLSGSLRILKYEANFTRKLAHVIQTKSLQMCSRRHDSNRTISGVGVINPKCTTVCDTRHPCSHTHSQPASIRVGTGLMHR